MSEPTPRASNAELRVLDVLWRRGPSTTRQIAEALHDDPTPVQYRTVQVQLDRLGKKGLVEPDRSRVPHVFEAAVDRARFVGEQLRDFADRVCDGSMAKLLLNLIESTELDREDRERLWKLLEEDDA